MDLIKKEINHIFNETTHWLKRKADRTYYAGFECLCQYIPDAKDYRIAAISDIKQNGPATIIFLKNDKKVVVKCQDNPYDSILGLNMCLIKYIIDNNRIYSDCINCIFSDLPHVFDKDNIKESIKRAELVLISHIGSEELLKIYEKFVDDEED